MTAYVGEIRMFAGNSPPSGWLFCEGQLLQISEHNDLFYTIGTIYGGDGVTTFALPDLRGRVVLHQGNGFIVGQTGGSETVTLTDAHLPAHTHSTTLQARATSGAGNSQSPGNAAWAATLWDQPYTDGPADADLAPEAVQVTLSPAGGGQPHENMPPFLGINYIIALSEYIYL